MSHAYFFIYQIFGIWQIDASQLYTFLISIFVQELSPYICNLIISGQKSLKIVLRLYRRWQNKIYFPIIGKILETFSP